MKHISFPSIEQFRHVIATINRKYNFIGLDENGDAIYDETKPKPVIKFKGTVKLHGTNAGVCYNKTDGLWAQSRENVITPQKDNAGFAFFVESNKDAFIRLIEQVAAENNIDTSIYTISIYGEWVGKGIQKGVGISMIEKSFFIFGVKISNIDIEDFTAYWVDSSKLKAVENKIYNIEDFKTFEVEVDFNYPQLAQNKIIDMTIEVEDECPVSKELGFPNEVGEGIVFAYTMDGQVYRFKSKGEKHSAKSKVKTLKPVDDEKINKVIEVVNRVCTESRLDQMVTLSCDLINGGTIERKALGDYIRLVINDIIKEDSDIIAEAGLEPKDINSKVSEVAKQYFFQRERDFVTN